MTVLGLERGVVRLVPYNPCWSLLFEEEKQRIQAVIGLWILDIQHVGSTSIPGCPAKPILDIAIAVANFEQAFICIPPLEKLGYSYQGEYSIPRRHYFVRRNPHSTHHIHMLEHHSSEWLNHLLFRDYLRVHPDAVEAYGALKSSLAARYPRDRDAYTEGKAEWIQGILAIARAEMNSRGGGN